MVYVDPARSYPYRGCASATREYCHLATDGDLDELHAFAERIGVPRVAFHAGARHPHYDLTPNRRTLAVEHGAVEVSSKELVRRCFLQRRLER